MTQTELLQDGLHSAQAILAEALADGESRAIQQARQAVSEATQALSDSVAIAEVTERRRKAAQALADQALQAERRKAIARLCDERGKLAGDLQKAIEKIGPLNARFLEVTGELAGSAPTCDVYRAQIISADQLVKHELALAGVTTNGFSHWELAQRPRISEVVSSSNFYLKGL